MYIAIHGIAHLHIVERERERGKPRVWTNGVSQGKRGMRVPEWDDARTRQLVARVVSLGRDDTHRR
jgi:hypothetical protein